MYKGTFIAHNKLSSLVVRVGSSNMFLFFFMQGMWRSALWRSGISTGGEFPGSIPLCLWHISPSTSARGRSLPVTGVQDQTVAPTVSGSAVLVHRPQHITTGNEGKTPVM